MKKMIFLMLTLLIMGAASVNAQVAIGTGTGADGGPVAGAVLELDGAQGGLLLPKATLDNNTFIPVAWGTSSLPAGVIVYNLGSAGLDAGVYVWDGSQWLAGTSGTVTPPPACLSAPAVPTGITFSKATGLKLNEQITATATPEVTSGDAIPTQYNWTIPATYFDIIGSTITRTITLQAKAASTSITSAIKVNAENTCGTSADYDNLTVVSILNCSAGPAQPGISGKDGSSGNEVITNQASLIYSVTTPVAGETYTWSSTGFILPGTITGNSITVTAPAAAGPATITVTPSNDCGSGAEKTLSVTVSAPSYPAGSVVINTDVRTGFISGTHGTLPTTAKSGKLLVYSTDGNSGLTITWNAMSHYQDYGTAYVNDDASKFEGASAGCEDGWRLPSVVEQLGIIAYFYATYGSYNGPTAAQVPGFIQLQNKIYWSSTYEVAGNKNWGRAWCLYPSSANAAGTQTNQDTNKFVRCVKDVD